MGNEAEARLHFSGKDSHTARGGGAPQSWRQMGCEHEAGSRVWGSSVCRWAEAGLQWVLEGVVQTWALQLGWVQDLHVLLPHGEMPRLRFH